MKSSAFYVGLVVVVTVVLFGVLFVQSFGLFERGAVRPVAAKAAMPDRTPAAAPAVSPSAAAPAPVRAENPAAPEPSLTSEIGRLRAENEALRGENLSLRARLIAVLNWMLANFRGKYPLPESFMSKVQLTPLTADFALHPDVIELLKITPDEQQNINDILQYARKYLTDIEAAVITVTNPRPDKVILHVPTFAEDGQVLKEDLYGALQVTLGPNRFDRFLKVSENGLKSSFYEFGEASRTMVFEMVYEPGQDMPQLKIKDGWVVELDPNTRTVTAMESVVTNLPPKYLAYLAWLPDYLVTYGAQ